MNDNLVLSCPTPSFPVFSFVFFCVLNFDQNVHLVFTLFFSFCLFYWRVFFHFEVGMITVLSFLSLSFDRCYHLSSLPTTTNRQTDRRTLHHSLPICSSRLTKIHSIILSSSPSSCPPLYSPLSLPPSLPSLYLPSFSVIKRLTLLPFSPISLYSLLALLPILSVVLSSSLLLPPASTNTSDARLAG